MLIKKKNKTSSKLLGKMVGQFFKDIFRGPEPVFKPCCCKFG